MKSKKADATTTTTFVNGGTNGNSSSFIPYDNSGKDQNDDETIATTATNATTSWNDFNKLNTEESGKTQDVFMKKEVIVPMTTTRIISSDSNSSTQSDVVPHNQLKGQARLASVVKYLEKSCPWTASITPLEMLQWLKSELDEIEKELKLLNAWNEWSEKKSNNVGDGDDDEVGGEREQRRIAEYECLINALTSEMGDILFDTIMLEMIIRR